MARPAARYVCQQCGAVHAKWTGRCDGCGGLEQPDRGTVERGAAERVRRETARSPRRPLARLCRPDRTEHAAAAPANRHRRARPRLRRRVRGGLGDPGRRRSRDRQVDIAASGGRRDRASWEDLRRTNGTARDRCLHHRRGGDRSGSPARRTSRRRRQPHAAGCGEQCTRHHRRRSIGRTRPIWSSSIRSRRCISTPWTARPVQSVKSAPRRRN